MMMKSTARGKKEESTTATSSNSAMLLAKGEHLLVVEDEQIKQKEDDGILEVEDTNGGVEQREGQEENKGRGESSSSSSSSANGVANDDADDDHDPPEMDGLIQHRDLRADDVLQGRGTGPNEYVGNVRYRALIHHVLERDTTAPIASPTEYPAFTMAENKRDFARQIIQTIKSRGGRFLERSAVVDLPREDDASSNNVVVLYREVTDRVAIEKTTQGFRHQLRLVRSSMNDGAGGDNKPRIHPTRQITTVSASSPDSASSKRQGCELKEESPASKMRRRLEESSISRVAVPPTSQFFTPATGRVESVLLQAHLDGQMFFPMNILVARTLSDWNLSNNSRFVAAMPSSLGHEDSIVAAFVARLQRHQQQQREQQVLVLQQSAQALSISPYNSMFAMTCRGPPPERHFPSRQQMMEMSSPLQSLREVQQQQRQQQLRQLTEMLLAPPQE